MRLEWRGVRFFVMVSDGDHLAEVADLVEDGLVCRPAVDWIVPFREFERAF